MVKPLGGGLARDADVPHIPPEEPDAGLQSGVAFANLESAVSLASGPQRLEDLVLTAGGDRIGVGYLGGGAEVSREPVAIDGERQGVVASWPAGEAEPAWIRLVDGATSIDAIDTSDDGDIIVGGDSILARYDRAGDELWTRSIPDGAVVADLAVAADDSVVVAAIVPSEPEPPAREVFGLAGEARVFAFDAAGEPLWSRVLGGDVDTGLYGIALAPGGDVILSGSSWANLRDLDLGTGPSGAYGDERRPGFILRLDAEGEAVWARELATEGMVRLGGLHVDSGGTIYAGGAFHGATDIGDGPHDAPGSWVFVAAYDEKGDPQWIRHDQIGSPRITGLTADGHGGVVLTGAGEGGSFGGGKLHYSTMFTVRFVEGEFTGESLKQASGMRGDAFIYRAPAAAGDLVAVAMTGTPESSETALVHTFRFGDDDAVELGADQRAR